jgi:predicted ATP-grasp superfamily ATP-dependent carboligase
MDHVIGANSSCGEQPGAAPILIVGASARAAAQSARRGGLEPWAADLFCDRDLIEACSHAVRIEHYPHGAERAFAVAPPGPWMYTGALENHPDLIDRIAAVRPLYGISGESMRAVRDPSQLAEAVRTAGFNAPRCSLSAIGVPTDGTWLIKPIASAGGHRVEPYVGHAVRGTALLSRHQTTADRLTAQESRPTSPPANCYFQERIEGVPASGVYIAHGNGAICLGVSRQLIGMQWCGAGHADRGRFRYCGSIAPIDVSALLARRFEKLGSALAHTFTLRGLFGLDAIRRGDEIWPLELNPRYTASVEILERSLGTSAVRLHFNSFLTHEETEETQNAVAWGLSHPTE